MDAREPAAAARCLCGHRADGIAWRWSQAATREEVPMCLPCKQAADAADRRAGLGPRSDLGWRWEWIEEGAYV